MTASPRLMRRARLVLAWFVLSLMANWATPALAVAMQLDESICTAGMPATDTGSGHVSHGHQDCSLCAPLGTGLPPDEYHFEWVLFDPAKPIQWVQAPIVKGDLTHAQARAPPPFLALI